MIVVVTHDAPPITWSLELPRESIAKVFHRTILKPCFERYRATTGTLQSTIVRFRPLSWLAAFLPALLTDFLRACVPA